MNKAIITTLIVFLMVGVCNVPALYALVWNGGYHEFSEGIEGEIDMINGATADITGGEIGILLCWDTSEVFVYEPSKIDLLRPSDFSTANVFGGTINHLFALNLSETRIHGGNISGIDPDDSSIIYLYTDNYAFDPTGGIRDGGLVTGEWLGTGETFSISLDDVGDINHIAFVPEPTTFLLLTSGMVYYLTRKKS